MSLTLTEVRRIAADVAREQDPPLEVMGATPSEGESTYAEVVLTVRGCRVEPCRVVIGITRDTSEADCRRNVEERLQQHLVRHRSDDAGGSTGGRTRGRDAEES